MSRQYLKPEFVPNSNTRNFNQVMIGLERGAGEGRLAAVHGRAGRGKTRTALHWHASHDSIYLRTIAIWTPKAFLAAMARELNAPSLPWSAAAAFTVVCDLLSAAPRPVFLDELERLPRIFLELVRDLTDSTGAPFILIGEEELLDWMRRERRVWSRTMEQVEFRPLSESDIVSFAAAAAGINLDNQIAAMLHKSAGGDYRIVKRDLGALLRISGGKSPTVKQAKTAVGAGVRGQ